MKENDSVLRDVVCTEKEYKNVQEYIDEYSFIIRVSLKAALLFLVIALLAIVFAIGMKPMFTVGIVLSIIIGLIDLVIWSNVLSFHWLSQNLKKKKYVIKRGIAVCDGMETVWLNDDKMYNRMISRKSHAPISKGDLVDCVFMRNAVMAIKAPEGAKLVD